MDTDRLERFANEWLSAWTGDRPDHLLTFYASDAFYLDPSNPKGLRGHDAIRPYFGKLLARDPEWVWTVNELISTAKGFILKRDAHIPVAEDASTCMALISWSSPPPGSRATRSSSIPTVG